MKEFIIEQKDSGQRIDIIDVFVGMTEKILDDQRENSRKIK